nr:hypothetical protein [Tanacetum cinerariifolium]
MGVIDGKADEGFLVGSSESSKAFRNTNNDAAFKVKEPEFEEKKPESEFHVSPSKFKDFFDNSINEVNAAGTSVSAVGQISTNSTNTFSVASPSNTNVSPTHGKSLYVDTSQYPNDPNMPELEDITYSDDEEDVGAEVDFTNLETNITISRIPTTRVHKDHHVTQIIDVFAPVVRIEAIILFLAYASFMGFMVYQMDVKSAFLYGTIEEEVYVCQPPGFEDLDYPDKDLCKAFEKLMKDKFQMSSMGKLTFFLGLQVKLKPDGIFISQVKYVAKIFRKFGLTYGKLASTPIDTKKPLFKDPDGENVDVHTYRSMIGSLMYLTSSRPYIMFAVCACARFQVTPKVSHLHAVKRIFRYLKGMIVAQQADDVADKGDACVDVDDVPDADEPSIPSPTPTTQPPLPSQELPSTSQFIPTSFSSPIAQLSLETCTTLTRKVEALEQDKVAQALEIIKLKQKGQEILLWMIRRKLLNRGIIELIDVDKDVNLENVKKDADVQGRQAKSQAQIYKIDLKHADKVLTMQDDELEPSKFKEVVEVATTDKLMTEVVIAAAAAITVATILITTTITTAPSAARRRKRVVIRDLEETVTSLIITHTECKSKDKGKYIMVEEPKPLNKQAQIKQDEAYTRESEAELNKNINWDDVIEQVQRKEKGDNVVLMYQAIKRKPQTEA